LNTKDGFSISGKNVGEICINSEDCKFGDFTDCGYPNPPSCTCEGDGAGNNICLNSGAIADEGVPHDIGGVVEPPQMPPPVVPPFRPPVPAPRIPPPAINTLEYNVHDDGNNPFGSQSIGEWCNPDLLNCVDGASCNGSKLDVDGILYYVCE